MEKKIIKFGQWFLKDTNQMVSLKWVVLKTEEDRILIHALSGIHVMAYDENGKSVYWESSSIREWLNNIFYEKAFDCEEKKRVIEVQTINRKDICSDTPVEYYVNDRVFLLSEDEIKEIGESSDFWRRSPSDFIKDSTYGVWWLRSYGRLERKSMGVIRSDGVLYPSGDIRANDVMIVPAVYIRKE